MKSNNTMNDTLTALDVPCLRTEGKTKKSLALDVMSCMQLDVGDIFTVRDVVDAAFSAKVFALDNANVQKVVMDLEADGSIVRECEFFGGGIRGRAAIGYKVVNRVWRTVSHVLPKNLSSNEQLRRSIKAIVKTISSTPVLTITKTNAAPRSLSVSDSVLSMGLDELERMEKLVADRKAALTSRVGLLNDILSLVTEKYPQFADKFEAIEKAIS